jgi:hypothetical protein
MSELERTKSTIIKNIKRLCAHCANGNHPHNCPVQQLADQVAKINGVPLIVNSEFKGVLFR